MTWPIKYPTYTFSATARELGVLLDQELTFAPHLRRLVAIAITNCDNSVLLHVRRRPVLHLLLSMPSLFHGLTTAQPFILVCQIADCHVLIVCCDLQRALSVKYRKMIMSPDIC